MRSNLLTTTALRAEDIPVFPADPWSEYERYCGADQFYLAGKRIDPRRVSFDIETMDAERRVIAYRVSA